jgi:hypothetical protein
MMNRELKKMIDDFFDSISKKELIDILTESGMGEILESPKETSEVIFSDYTTRNIYYDTCTKSKYEDTRLYSEAA